MYIGLHVKYPLFLSDFNETWIIDRFSKNPQVPNFMKIRPARIKLLHVDVADGHEANSRFFFAILRTRLKTLPAATSPASLRCAIVSQILLMDDEALSRFLTNENCQYVISMKSERFICSTHSLLVSMVLCFLHTWLVALGIRSDWHTDYSVRKYIINRL